MPPIVDAAVPPQLEYPPAGPVEWHITRADREGWWHLVVKAQFAQQAIRQAAIILKAEPDELVAKRGDR